jgi:hypothetical protein
MSICWQLSAVRSENNRRQKGPWCTTWEANDISGCDEQRVGSGTTRTELGTAAGLRARPAVSHISRNNADLFLRRPGCSG